MTAAVDTDEYHTQTKEGAELVIREARSDEDYYRAYPVLLQLIPDLDMQTYAQRVFVARATGYRMFMAELDEDVVGVIGVIHNHNLHDGFVTYIEQVVIDEDHRGKGYGALLLEFAEKRAKEEGCDEIELDVDENENPDAEAFYKRNGFKVSGKYLYKSLKE
ncbi:MAG TPA: GNAT family N-acetyltransferase [Micavibrio sp.]|nr:GNAT family N-acetyltransferase [Micavibrio sp.]HIL29824.1 GNAT family N-acetyltransferase [Micavibrio sp.]